MKKILCLVIASMLTVLALFSASAQCNHTAISCGDDGFLRPVYGDANHDRIINMHDVTDIQRYIAELERSPFFCGGCANVYEEAVDMQDVVYIQKYIAGLKPSCRCGETASDWPSIIRLEIDEETKSAIEKAYIEYRRLTSSSENFNENDYNNLDVEYYGTIGEDIMIVMIDDGSEHLQTYHKYVVKDYYYMGVHSGCEIFLYIDGEYISINNALDKNLISDEEFKELVFHLHMKKNN